MWLQWIGLGLDPDQFWRKTGREILAICEGKQIQIRREHNESAWAAWHMAALGRAKKFPTLDSMMIRERRRQSWQEQKELATAWVLASGGKIIEPSKAH